GGSRHARRDGARDPRRPARRGSGHPALGLASLKPRAAGGVQSRADPVPRQGLRAELALADARSMPLGFAGAPLVRKLRLAAGLTLFTYVLLHLTNHSLGLVSYQAMDAGLCWAPVLGPRPPAPLPLPGAFLAHLSLGLWALYRRRTLPMPAWEALQLLFGLAI